MITSLKPALELFLLEIKDRKDDIIYKTLVGVTGHIGQLELLIAEQNKCIDSYIALSDAYKKIIKDLQDRLNLLEQRN